MSSPTADPRTILATGTGPDGLNTREVAVRREAGLTNTVTERTSRSVGEIVRANTLTVFNALLVTLFAITLLTGRWQNGLFGGVVVANATIGIAQELRAKRTLDRLAILNSPRARVRRDGLRAEIPVGDVVLGDLVELETGDQVPADGVVRVADGLEVNESLLTGESRPVLKDLGDEMRSGSFVVAGKGRFEATAVGASSYVHRLAAEARRFTLTASELVAGTNRLLRWISVLMLVVGPLVLWSQFRTDENRGWQEAVTGTVAALVGMVPEGLVLLTSLAFMVATISLARRQTLVQELPAVEGLARVDTVCFDKTGTLTHGDIGFDELHVCGPYPRDEIVEALAVFGGQGPSTNAVATELVRVFGAPPWVPAHVIAFSSARKWSAVAGREGGSWILGAPEIILPRASENVREAVQERAAEGMRVLLLARTDAALGRAEAILPDGCVPAALVGFSERVREDATATVAYFAAEHVTVKVISGDNPTTVGSIAVRVGVPGISSAQEAVDARTLPSDVHELADVLERHTVFGRVAPHQKRAMVAALQSRGHVVAMTGDGVNDALALKDADIGVAMGGGSSATRAVAQLVLLDDRFSHLPEVVAEGRRVTANIERAASLFVVKNVYSLTLALICAVSLEAYPLAPIQLTLVSTLTIGVPAFFLALAPNTRRYHAGFIRRVLRFAVPSGLVVGGCAYSAYRVARAADAAGGREGGRTVAALVVLGTALWILTVLARPLTLWKAALLTAIGAAVVLGVALPVLGRDVFLLHPTAPRVGLALLFVIAGALAVELVYRLRDMTFGPSRTGHSPIVGHTPAARG